jgi:alcohol dehydrogenase YqhD (iron-dependent ADH family)
VNAASPNVVDRKIVNDSVQPAPHVQDLRVVPQLVEQFQERHLDQVFSLACRPYNLVCVSQQGRAHRCVQINNVFFERLGASGTFGAVRAKDFSPIQNVFLAHDHGAAFHEFRAMEHGPKARQFTLYIINLPLFVE